MFTEIAILVCCLTRNKLLSFQAVIDFHSRFEKKNHLRISVFIWFGFVGFYGIPNIIGYLKPNPLYTYVLNIYDLAWLGFMAYQIS